MRRLCFVFVLALGCKRSAPTPPAPPAEEPNVLVPARFEAPPPTAEKAPADEVPNAPAGPMHLDLEVVDLTTEDERPAAMGDTLEAIARGAATASGFSLSGTGKATRALVEMHYALLKDGKVEKNADRGLITWGVSVGVRVVGADKLAEVLEGRALGQVPFVREALPSMEAAFREVLANGTRSAFLDVAMQLRYRDASLTATLDGLRSMLPEERWAATRRVAELPLEDARKTVPTLLSNLETSEGLEVGLLAVACARLQETRAIAELVARIDGLPESVAMVVVDALHTFEGDEAQKALARIAQNHPIDAVRAAAGR